MIRAGALSAAALSLVLSQATAQAKPALGLEATTLLGSGSQESSGWRSVLIQLENRGPVPLSGEIRIESRPSFAANRPTLTTQVPFFLAPRGRVNLEAPTHGFGASPPSLKLSAVTGSGEKLAELDLGEAFANEILILDLSSPARIAPLLREIRVPSRRVAPYVGHVEALSIGVLSAPTDPTTGDPLLPELSSGYAGATLILASGRTLSRLGEPRRQALADWVLAGGALGLSLDRPDDFADPLVGALLGGRPRAAPVPEALAQPAIFYIVPEGARFGGSGPSGTPIDAVQLSPAPELEAKLKGYEGGNLHPDRWGASASYGLGEVHLLAFDPDEETAAGDAWAAHEIADLSRHARDRGASVVMRHAMRAPDFGSIESVRRELDPNHAARWTIVVSALVLLIYASLAGPLGFHLAARRGRPLRALWQLPIWSAATLSVVVLLGLFGKGISGRARKLSLVEAGAGMTRAAAVRFRGFYAATESKLRVRPRRRGHVLDLAGDTGDLSRTLVVDRDGPRLEDLQARPWETVLIREDGFIDLSGGISVVQTDTGYSITNRVARDLIGVVLRLPSGDAVYFRRIKDGQTVQSSAGKKIGTIPGPHGSGMGGVTLESRSFAPSMDADFSGMGRAWAALGPAAQGDVEWWPNDVPVLLAQLDGGEGRLVDSGLPIDYDRVLVRVVGVGGVP